MFNGLKQITRPVSRGISCGARTCSPIKYGAPSVFVPRRVSYSSLPTSFKTKVNQESFLNGDSANFIESLHVSWQSDPNSVSVSWRNLFEKYSSDPTPSSAHRSAAGAGQNLQTSDRPAVGHPENDQNESSKTVDGHFAVQWAIRAYQTRGHYAARTDPLRSSKADRNDNYLAEVLYRSFPPFADSDMDKVFKLPPTTLIGGRDRYLPLRDILARLESVYCRSVGVEYMHINSSELCTWIREKIEVPDETVLDNGEKLRIHGRLAKAAGFESFLARKWASEKRFGLEGCEVLIPAMNEIIDTSSAYGVDAVFIGMPHRGRLNVLANVCHKPLHTILVQFQGLEATDEGSGDVKYHLGTCVEHTNETTDKKMKLALVANPSHLEAVDSVVQGKTRAEQFFRGDAMGSEVMSILLHGDASFCGQGVVYETFHLSDLPDYTTHGTIHIVVNNQVGFTTDPKVSRSSDYCTDVAKVVDAPIFHVNADDPEAVIRVCKIAAEWRKTFKRDVVIDLVGYRRNGHNEADEPMFTQPFMYTVIKNTRPVFEKYSELLVNEKVLTVEDVKEIKDAYEKHCEEAYLLSKKETHFKYGDWLDSPWPGFFKNKNLNDSPKTGVDEETLRHIGQVFSSIPPDDTKFVVHKGIERIFKSRQQMINDRTVDWALAEAMAFGSLLKTGTHVRLSGQDVERGTFSHRHHVLHSQTIDMFTYRPLGNLFEHQAPYSVSNSSLSEYAVLGFELGFSMTNPNALVCWEAQFGDFNNTAQCIIDQFVSSGQAKWKRQTGLVMLLPHGYEGMGPEHSSARLERFLQMSSENADIFPEVDEQFATKQLNASNWIIANCSTPANYFHILRRQMALPFRKPLVIMTPKSLLRHPDAKSSFDEMIENTEFSRVIPDNGDAIKNAPNVKRLIFCTGKVYYDLVDERKIRELSDTVAICRVEQISPFPFDLVNEECAKYEKADIIWTQEEPKNQGAWNYVQPRIETSVCGCRSIGYAGRPVAASPATGNKVQHLNEIKSFLADSFLI